MRHPRNQRTQSSQLFGLHQMVFGLLERPKCQRQLLVRCLQSPLGILDRGNVECQHIDSMDIAIGCPVRDVMDLVHKLGRVIAYCHAVDLRLRPLQCHIHRCSDAGQIFVAKYLFRRVVEDLVMVSAKPLQIAPVGKATAQVHIPIRHDARHCIRNIFIKTNCGFQLPCALSHQLLKVLTMPLQLCFGTLALGDLGTGRNQELNFPALAQQWLHAAIQRNEVALTHPRLQVKT